jgi:hypothetical protein
MSSLPDLMEQGAAEAENAIDELVHRLLAW